MNTEQSGYCHIMLKGWEHLEALQSEGYHERIGQRLEHVLERQRDVIGEAAWRQSKGLSPLASPILEEWLDSMNGSGTQEIEEEVARLIF